MITKEDGKVFIVLNSGEFKEFEGLLQSIQVSNRSYTSNEASAQRVLSRDKYNRRQTWGIYGEYAARALGILGIEPKGITEKEDAA